MAPVTCTTNIKMPTWRKDAYFGLKCVLNSGFYMSDSWLANILVSGYIDYYYVIRSRKNYYSVTFENLLSCESILINLLLKRVTPF